MLIRILGFFFLLALLNLARLGFFGFLWGFLGVYVFREEIYSKIFIKHGNGVLESCFFRRPSKSGMY